MGSSIYEQDWDEDRQIYVSGRKVGLPLGPNAPHHPNKAERAELKRLMREGQCSEEEVRKSKGNRQKLAKAAKSPMARGSTDRRDLEKKRVRRQLAKSKGVETYEVPETEVTSRIRSRWY